MLAGHHSSPVYKSFSTVSATRSAILPLIGSLIALSAITAHGQSDNGIHVGKPKVYDSRELTLMLDNLSQSLQGKQFVDPAQLAKALGNVQGFRENDTSFAFQANGAVGPGAASVFAGTAGAASTAPATDSSSSVTPGVTINVSPTLNAGSTTAPAATTSAPATTGPQPPALPSLQTPPSYTPTFGSNGSDLLSDEVNLTYQLYNVRMLLDRSLTDRMIGKKPRLQAVVGFDIDIEPDKTAKDAAAVVQVSVSMNGRPGGCSADGIGMVALMPEEGSHNTATLSQKANAFGGALAASVYSVGVAAQKRSQVFYLYRDMDTVSFEQMDGAGSLAAFGWQFRPVLGRRSVDPGMRHLIAVLSLPCEDEGEILPTINVAVKTSWRRYESDNQTTTGGQPFWHHLPGELPTNFTGLEVPSTVYGQNNLAPIISDVRWLAAADGSGVAVVSGENLFPGTTVRLGSKLYRGGGDGLVIKSDKELEVPIPLSLATVGGVVSGRYGTAVALEKPVPVTDPCRLRIARLRTFPAGNETVQVDADMSVFDPKNCAPPLSWDTLQSLPNSPIALVNGTPISSRPFSSGDAGITYATMVPTEIVNKMTSFGIAFPFAGQSWTAISPYFQAGLQVTRLGSPTNSILLLASTDSTNQLCSDSWTVELDSKEKAVIPTSNSSQLSGGSATCADKMFNIVALSVPSTLLKGVHHVMLTRDGNKPLIGDIPAPDPPPPGPTLDKSQKVSVAQNDVGPVTFKGTHLDEITKVLFDKTELGIVNKSATQIVVSLSKVLTAKPREVGLLMLSDGNDPLIAPLTVTPAKKGK